jgi:hypothetical protein
LDDPVFYPYCEAAQELHVPLFCHPNSDGDLTDRFDTFFKLHVLGRPMNCTAALEPRQGIDSRRECRPAAGLLIEVGALVGEDARMAHHWLVRSPLVLAPAVRCPGDG